MTEENQDFEMYAGEDKQLNIAITGTPDISGYDLFFRCSGFGISKDKDDGISLAGDNSTVLVELETADTQGQSGKCAYECQVTDLSSDVSIITTGVMEVKKSGVE